MPSLASSVRKASAKAACSAARPSSRSARAETALIWRDGQRRLAGEPARPGERGVEQLVVGDDAVDEPVLVGLVGRDRVADQVHLQCLVLPHEPRQPLGAAEAGDDPELDLGLAEQRRLGGDAHVAGHRQLAAAAERDAVDGRDRRHAGRAEVAHQRVRASSELAAALLVHLRERLDVGAGAEQRAGWRRRSPARGRPRTSTALPDGCEVGDDLRRDRVHLPVGQPGDGDVAARLELDELAGLVVVGLRVGVEALAALRAQAALGDEAAQDRPAARSARRGARRRCSRRSRTTSRPSTSAFMNGGSSPRRGSRPAPAIIPTSMSRCGGDALLEHEARLDERLQREQLDELVDVGLGVAVEVGLAVRS